MMGEVEAKLIAKEIVDWWEGRFPFPSDVTPLHVIVELDDGKQFGSTLGVFHYGGDETEETVITVKMTVDKNHH